MTSLVIVLEKGCL